MENNESEIAISEEIVKTTKVVKKRATKRAPNSKFYKRFLECLDKEEHSHMLSYVPNSKKTQCEVTFIDRKNSAWKRKDISLFLDLDHHLREAFDRKRPPGKIENDCKSRFRSNMGKCKKWIKFLSEREITKCKIVRTYEILWRPTSVGEPSGDNQEIIGNGGKSTRKSQKKEKKKGKKNTTVSLEKVATPGFGSNCLEENDFVSPENNIIKSKNHSERSKYIILENVICNTNTAITSLIDFGKNDLSNTHYSCLSSNSQMDIDGNGDSNCNFEKSMALIGQDVEINGMDIDGNGDSNCNLAKAEEKSIALIGQDVEINVAVAETYPDKMIKIDFSRKYPNVYACGQNIVMELFQMENLKNQDIADYEYIEMASDTSEGNLYVFSTELEKMLNSQCEILDSNVGGYGNGRFEENQVFKLEGLKDYEGYGCFEENVKSDPLWCSDDSGGPQNDSIVPNCFGDMDDWYNEFQSVYKS